MRRQQSIPITGTSEQYHKPACQGDDRMLSLDLRENLVIPEPPTAYAI